MAVQLGALAVEFLPGNRQLAASATEIGVRGARATDGQLPFDL
jgi:hypothetical protein